MVFINPCGFSRNQAGVYNLASFRKGILAELFAMWLLYFSTQIFLRLKYQMNEEQKEEQLTRRLPWNNRLFKQTITIVLGNHAVALSFVVLHNPLPAALGIAWFNFLVYSCFVFVMLRGMQRASKILSAGLQLINIWLIVAGLVGFRFQEPASYSPFNCIMK